MLTKPPAQSNWSGTITFNPDAVAAPKTVDELRALVRAAHEKRLQVRPRGTGHSWNDAIATAGLSLDTRQLGPTDRPIATRTITDPDGTPYLLLTVSPAMNQGDFSRIAQDLGCPLPTQGPAPDITLSGFTANGCHGTGWQQPTIAELVYGVQLVGPDGALLDFDETTVPAPLRDLGFSAPELMQIVRVHLGALGVLTQITFKLARKPFNLRARNEFVRLTRYLDRNDPAKLKALIEQHDYVELFWFPYNNWKWKGGVPTPLGPETDTLWVMTFDRTEDKPTATAPLIELWNDAMGALAVVGEANGWVVSRHPNAVPALSSFALTNMKWKNHFNNGVVFKPRDAFLYQKRYFKSFLDLEFTIPMHGDQGFADVVAGFWQLVDRMEAWRTDKNPQPYPINLSVHARFIRNSQALLSPALAPAGSPTHTCYIEYLSYSYGHLTTDYDNFSKDFYSPDHGAGWKRFGGIPNWGKDLGSVPGVASYVHDIIAADDRLKRFLAVRDRIDPGGATFTNRYLASFFTGRELPPRSPTAALAAQQAQVPANPAPASRSLLMAPIDLARLPTAANPWTRQTPTGGQLELIHDLAHGVAYLTNEHGELNILAVEHDPATHHLTYTTASPSQHLQPAQILDRVQSMH